MPQITVRSTFVGQSWARLSPPQLWIGWLNDRAGSTCLHRNCCRLVVRLIVVITSGGKRRSGLSVGRPVADYPRLSAGVSRSKSARAAPPDPAPVAGRAAVAGNAGHGMPRPQRRIAVSAAAVAGAF